MALSLLTFLGIAYLTAYVAAHALGRAPSHRAILRLVGTVDLMAFGAGSIFNSIWYNRPWRAYVSDVVDAILFSLAMAVVFGWLWPR
jgi:hypothetical protein